MINLTHRINYNMLFSSFRFFPIESALLPGTDGFHALRVNDGSGLPETPLPSVTARTSMKSLSCAANEMTFSVADGEKPSSVICVTRRAVNAATDALAIRFIILTSYIQALDAKYAP